MDCHYITVWHVTWETNPFPQNCCWKKYSLAHPKNLKTFSCEKKGTCFPFWMPNCPWQLIWIDDVLFCPYLWNCKVFRFHTLCWVFFFHNFFSLNSQDVVSVTAYPRINLFWFPVCQNGLLPCVSILIWKWLVYGFWSPSVFPDCNYLLTLCTPSPCFLLS